MATSGSAVLLLCTLSLWMLQTTMPVFQPYLPYLSPIWRAAPQQIPFSQILACLSGLLCYLSAYYLLYQRSGGVVSLTSNLLFVLFGYMITYGHGMHTVCVLVQEKGESSVSPSMAVYVEFLHKVVSHNMFVGGIYAMMILIMKAEKDCFGYKLQKMTEKKTGATTNGYVATSNESVQNGFMCPPNGAPPSSSATASSEAASCITENLSKIGVTTSPMQNFLLQWTWPVILGAYFSIFAAMTGTVPITLLFYAFIYTYTILSCQNLDSCTIPTGAVMGLLDSELFVWATVVKAASAGLPALGLWLWTHH